MRSKVFIACITVLLLVACKKDDPQPVDLGLNYFPVEEGRYVEYTVDSMFIDEQSGLGAAVTLQYEMRELIAEEFIDQAGRTVQRLERFVKDSTGNWIIRDVWSQHRNSQYAERVEENHRKQRLAFRPELTKLWNLNALNGDSAFVPDLGAGTGISEVELTYEEIDVPYQINGMNFDSTVLVTSTYPSNIIVKLIEEERYAKGVGLIEKRWVEINSQWDTFTQSYEDTGFEVTYTVTGYGRL